MKNLNKLYFLIFIVLIGCEKKNSLELNFSKPINKSEIKIEMEILGSKTKKIIFDGNKEYEIPDGYGENEWYFCYKDSLFAYFRHFKTNRNDSHFYKYDFVKKEGKIFILVKIEGNEPMNKTIILTAKKKIMGSVGNVSKLVMH